MSDNFFDDDVVSETIHSNHLASLNGRDRFQGDILQDETNPGSSSIAGVGEQRGHSRRRRTKQPTVTFPSFEDELKEGTQLYNQQVPKPGRAMRAEEVQRNGEGPRHSKSNGDVVERRFSTRQQPQAAQRETEPRQIGSQFLDLNRGLALNVSTINEDIVALSREDIRDALRTVELPKQAEKFDLQSQPADRIYVERKGKFYALSKRPEEWIETPVSDPLKPEPVKETRLNLNLHKSSRHLFLFAHGLLAGLALFHCIIIFYASPPHQSDWAVFTHVYLPIAVIIKTLYQALVALCCLSCLCRLDLAGGLDRHLLTDHFEALISTMLYFAAAALTHLCDVTTMRLLHEAESPVVPPVTKATFSGDLQDELVRWKVMDAVRTGCFCVGWLLVACRWKRDRMLIHLERKVL
ncbi:hypothetical protein BV898_02572 [Hypsibius exemplaris]|uniref:Transmembrane protein 237 n=1 Tax=Hypsibius exemplaris TaxID=2072580 RepID=A0A1W0X7U6_HYPEX|nr:hypothetical protein BV898_02572 [Hypsibius exemplaris]